MKKHLFVFALACSAASAYAQRPAMQTLPLDDMSAFKTQAGNWQITGDVIMNPAVDIPHGQAPAPADSDADSKKKKKSKQPATPEAPSAVTVVAGKGILLNMNDATRKDNLITAFEHGDIELELEVMLPRGSNSGIYLQGRYEVQLFDSWGVRNPKFSDIGGIYRNWERAPEKIYMGKAPLSNPSKAPGLWQKMRIAFRAPKFDATGIKIANARFTYVELNGIKIHDNVEVPLPTGGPVQNNERPSGPIMIQGDHGPVAFRNIRYRLMREADITLSDITYKTYYGNFKSVADYTSLKPAGTGTLNALTCEILEQENDYGSTYAGNITIAEDGEYEFALMHTGGVTFTVNNQELVNLQRPDARGRGDRKKITLKAGTYPFEIQNFKSASWMPPRLGLFVQSESIYPKALHATNSFPQDTDDTSPILINPTDGPRLLRAFIDFKRNRSKRLTHTIGVGEPSGINYVYDLKAGNIVCVWRGNFVDATPMWHQRGDGSFRPLGATQYLFVNQPLAFLANEQESFPATSDDTNFRGKGYQIDEATARPVFKYTYQGLDVVDKVYPEDNNRIITHEVTINNRGDQKGLYYKLAEGSSIITMPDGSYAIDDKQYYIKTSDAVKPLIRDVNGTKELVMPVQGNSVKYSIIW